MSYMREPHYIWVSGSADKGGETIHIDHLEMDMPVFDELVLMRVAEMTPEQFQATALRAAARYAGNIGGSALAERLGDPSFVQVITALLDLTREDKERREAWIAQQGKEQPDAR